MAAGHGWIAGKVPEECIFMKPFWLIPVLLVVLAVSPGVSAVNSTLTAEGVSSYSFVADSGMVIYQITVNDLPIGANQSHTFNVGSNIYLLTVGTYEEWGWRNADISLTMPNGTVQTAHASGPAIFASKYKTQIQYVFPQIYSMEGAFSINLFIGMTPASASFYTAPSNWNPSTALAFTAASGNFDQPTTIYLEEMSEEDFKNNVVKYNPLYGLSHLGSQIFQWTWDTILGFLNMIPVIGPIAVSLIEIMGGILGVGWYWLLFTVQNFPAILFGVETLICMMAVINAGKGSKSLGKLGKNIVSYNAMFLYAIVVLVELVFNWTVKIVEMITSIVQALKPI